MSRSNKGEHLGNWTDDRVEVLRTLWLQGVSGAQIAKHLNGGVAVGWASRSAVIAKAWRMGLTGRTAPSTPAKYEPVKPKPRTSGSGFGLPRYDGKANPLERKMDAIRLNIAAQASPARIVTGKAWEPLTGVPSVPFLSRVYGQCAWPLAHEGSADMACCGGKAEDGPYCETHRRLGYAPHATRDRLDVRLRIKPRKRFAA